MSWILCFSNARRSFLQVGNTRFVFCRVAVICLFWVSTKTLFFAFRLRVVLGHGQSCVAQRGQVSWPFPDGVRNAIVYALGADVALRLICPPG